MSCVDDDAARRLKAAEELLETDAAQAATSLAGQRNAEGADQIIYRGDGFRMVRRDKVWTVEEETSHNEWEQCGGHFQRRQDASSYVYRLKRSRHSAQSREARQAAVASHLMGVSFSPDQATREAALALSTLLPILDLELTDSAKQPGQCNVNDLGVRLAASDHVVDAIELITRDGGVVRQVVRNLLHSASPSVGESGDLTVGDGQATEGDLSPSVAEPLSRADVPVIVDSIVELVAERMAAANTFHLGRGPIRSVTALGGLQHARFERTT